jgi:hypothetical protein
MNKKTLALVLVSSAAMLACTTTETQSRREESARPRVEQRALSNAIDIAFKQVNLSQVVGQKVFLETQALSKLDVGFINGYLTSVMLEKGALVVADEKMADLKILSIVKISGTDEIKRKILSDKVRGEFRSVMSIIDLKNNTILKTYEVSGESDENR